MARKKSPLESAGRRKRAYELEGLPIGGYPMDPMRQIEDQALRDLSNEYRQLRIEEMISKKKRQLSKSEPTEGIQTQRQNLEMIKMMMEIAKMNQPQQGKDNTLEYVKMFKDLMLESSKLQGRGPSFFETMLGDAGLYQRTQDMFSRGKEGEANQFSLEIEKIRGDRMLQSKKFDLEIQREALKRDLDMQKLNLLLGSLSPIVALGAGKMEQSVKQRGINLGRSINPTSNPNPSGEMSEVRIQCNCGFDSPMFFAGDPPSQVSCPGCGAVLSIGVEGSSEEGSQDWSQKSQNF